MARENLTDHLPINQRENKVRQRLLKIRAKKVITATGSIERPLIFDNNDRPGILLSSAIKKYIDLFDDLSEEEIRRYLNIDFLIYNDLDLIINELKKLNREIDGFEISMFIDNH